MSYQLQTSLYGSGQAVEPPDTQLAAGPTSLLEMDNSTGSEWTKSGALLATVDLNVFFSVPAGYSFSDPRVVYDADTQRWVASGMSFDATGASQVYLAVSAGADPGGQWYVYVVSDEFTLSDQPMLGIVSDKVILSWNDLRSLADTAFLGEETHVVDKLEMIQGAAQVEQWIFGPDTLRFRLVPAVALTTTSTAWIAYNNADCISGLSCNMGTPTEGLLAVTGRPGQSNVVVTEYDSPVGEAVTPPDPAQPGGGTDVENIDGRMLSATWAAGVLWTARTDGCIPPGEVASRDCMRLDEIAASTASVQPKVLSDVDAYLSGADLYYPAVTLDRYGDAFVVFSASSATLYPSVAAVDAPVGSPTAFGSPTWIAQGTSRYSDLTAPRWGDYSSAAPDPDDGTAVWLAGEFAPSPLADSWGTAAARIVMQPLVESVAPNSGPASLSPSITVTGAYFESGAQVTFGSQVAPSINVIDSREIIVTPPLTDKAGPVDVTVVNPNGGSTIERSAYTYTMSSPSAPRAVIATAGPGEAKVTWGAPVSNGGAPVVSYTVTSVPAVTGVTVSGTTYQAVVTGLTNGGVYTFLVVATNAQGSSPPASSNAVRPATTPGQPRNVTAQAGEERAVVSWFAPTDNGGSVILYYSVTSSPGGVTATAMGGATTATLVGLVHGTTYTFTVTATNAVGSGPPSDPSNAIVPSTVGYWLVASDGGIFAYGDAPFFGSTGGIALNRAIVGMAATRDGQGYWLVASDGGIFAFGDAPFYGSMGSVPLNRPIVGMARTPEGGGYWLVGTDGGIFAFGDAAFYGSTGSVVLNRPIVGMTATRDGRGYWLASSDGGIFAFGSAAFYGSTGNLRLSRPIVGMTAAGDGAGYWLVASDGGVFAFGDAAFYGSAENLILHEAIVGVTANVNGNGYRLVGSDGGIFAFGDAPFLGSTGGTTLNQPIVGMEVLPA